MKVFSSPGFSILELLVVLSISSILFGSATYAYLRNSETRFLHYESTLLVRTIRSQELRSLTSRRPTHLKLHRSGYTIENGSSYLLKKNITLFFGKQAQETLSFFPTGVASPATLILKASATQCVMKISLRGRIHSTC